MNNKHILMFFLYSVQACSFPPEKGEDPSTLYVGSAICRTDGNISKTKLDEIKRNALVGDSISSIFLANNLGLIKGYEDEDTSKWLELADSNQNPIASLYMANDLILSGNKINIEKGIHRAELIAELGLIEAMDLLIDLYSGNFESINGYENRYLADYWRKRVALSGSLYRLKLFVKKNPNKLGGFILKAWRDAYNFLENKRKSKVAPEISNEALWLVSSFENNRDNLLEVLEKHHELYSGFKYCNPN